MERNSKYKYSRRMFIGMLFLFVLLQFAFYKMMIEAGDNIAHINFARSILNPNYEEGYLPHMKAYPLYHLTVKLVSLFCLGDYSVAGSCVLIAANIASVIIARHILFGFLQEDSVVKKYILDFVSIAYLIFEPVAGYLTDGRIYARQCGPNPWHNPTITFVRPIGLLTFIMFVCIIRCFRADISYKEYRHYLIGFSVSSILTVLAKPSFMMVFMPAMGIYAFFFWMKDIKGRFTNVMKLLLAVMPTAIIVFGQMIFFQIVNAGTAGQVKIALGGFSGFSLQEMIKVCIATFPIPLLALVLYGREILKNDAVNISYIALVIGVIEMFMFTNGSSGDFSWGYDLAVGMSTILVLGDRIANCKGYKSWRCILLIALFTWQTIVGMYYLISGYQRGGAMWF